MAYIDPGAGGILLQVIIAGILGVGYFFRSTTQKILGIFRRKRPPEAPNTETPKQ